MSPDQQKALSSLIPLTLKDKVYILLKKIAMHTIGEKKKQQKKKGTTPNPTTQRKLLISY